MVYFSEKMLQASEFFTYTINILRCDQWCGFSLLFLYFPKSKQETTSTYKLSVWVSEIPEITSFSKPVVIHNFQCYHVICCMKHLHIIQSNQKHVEFLDMKKHKFNKLQH